MDGYRQKFLMVRSSTLEEYFGWTFERKIPRRGNKRADHLEYANAIKHAGEAVKKKQAIAKYIKQNPTASMRQIERETGINRRTISKYYPKEK